MTGPPRPADRQSAWRALRHYQQSVTDHSYSNALWWISTSLGLSRHNLGRVRADDVRDDWAGCANFLRHDVLPFTGPLRDILLSKVVLNDMARDEAVRWERTLDSPDGIDETTTRLDDLLDRITAGSRPEQYEIDDVLADLDWWERFFLGGKDSLLSRIVRRCPVELTDLLADGFEGTDHTIDAGDLGRVEVFCTSRLLRETLHHLRYNAERTHRLAGSPQRFAIAVREEQAGRITVTVRNTGSTRETSGGGKGLETLHHRLVRFGGDLTEVAAGPPWTYAIAVALDRWRMLR